MPKHLILKLYLIIAAFTLVSWGRVGHQAIGYIAESHLTPKAAQEVKQLLGNETLADVSTYADEIRWDSLFYQFTGRWHYLDVPAEENFVQFKESVNEQTIPNIYTALQHWEKVLADPRANVSIKIFALKMVVHFVGDAHQPLHIGRAIDEGGNLIPVWFDNDSTNLHALWDTKLIEHKGLSPRELAKACDFATTEDIKVWQADPLIGWLYESNHIGNHIYDENPGGKRLGQPYYDSHIEMVCQRIDQAGVRLAGILNQIFDPTTATKRLDTTICDKVFDGKFLEGNQITFLNLGGAYPNQKISVVIKGKDRDKFKEAPEKLFVGKTICVKGVVEIYKGRPEIIVTEPEQIVVQ